MFPPFWIFGAFILLSPLREPPPLDGFPAWMPEKTEAERREIIEKMRVVEIKWSKRCLYALIVATILAIVAGVTIWTLVVEDH